MQRKGEEGQAIILVILATSIFLIGALGLAIDGAHLYAQRQMAQTAADAAAQAGIMSVFDGTNATAANPFGTETPPASFTCTATDGRTPCVYAQLNGFTSTTNNLVTVDFAPTATAPGVNLYVDPAHPNAVNLIKVTVQRTVNTTLIGLLGPSTSSVKATATAAIVDVVAPVPILVTHPTLASAFSMSGNPTVTICGGPQRSIQVNSTSTTSVSTNINSTVDLSHAGPPDNGDCSTGTGSDFGDFGGPSSPTFTFIKGSGSYLQPASPILDPLANIPAPAKPAAAPAKTALANGVSGCPASPGKACNLYSPGLYTGGLSISNETAVFKPGIYYMDGGGFSNTANGDMYSACITGATGCTGGVGTDAVTGSGMVVYNTGAGVFNVGANSRAVLTGSDLFSTYKGILFFEDRTAAAQSHTLGGNGCLGLVGTIYITNTLDIMTTTPSQYQSVSLQGTPCSGTNVTGEIIASALSLGGNAGIKMNLTSRSLHIRQVALVQ